MRALLDDPEFQDVLGEYGGRYSEHPTPVLANDPAHTSVLEEMRGRLKAWMAETDDPLLRRPVPAPVKAEIKTRDQLSADDPTTTVT